MVSCAYRRLEQACDKSAVVVHNDNRWVENSVGIVHVGARYGPYTLIDGLSLVNSVAPDHNRRVGVENSDIAEGRGG